MPTPVKNFLQCIPGFLQSRAQSNQGLPILAHELVVDYNFTGLAQVELDEWNTDWNTQAEWIYRLALPETPKVMVVAYSWGAGYGFTRLARALRDRGIEITHAVLSDPVYHLGPRWCHSILGKYFSPAQIKAYYPYFFCTRKLIDWHLLPPRPTIAVPDNVLAVDYFIQRNSKLCGHELRPESTKTKINRIPVDYRTHTNMDDLPEFRNRCRVVAQELFGVANPGPPPKPKRRGKNAT